MATILVIDDNEFVRSFIEDALADTGHTVLLASGGKQGLELFKTASPDCILLDILMPDLDGIEVLREIRLLDNETNVLLMTGDDPGWAKRKYGEYGANNFLSKSLLAEEFVEAVEDALMDGES